MDIKWYWIAVIVATIMFGVYKTTELVFNRLDHIQQLSREVIEK